MTRTLPMLPRLLPAALLALAAAGCGGGLGYRSVVSERGELEIGAEIDEIRLEIENGTLRIMPSEKALPGDVSSNRKLTYVGGARRAGNTAEDLASIEAVPIRLDVAATDGEPRTLTVRGPMLPAGVVGVIGFEAEIYLPADIRLDVRISNNGHVVLVDRAAFTKVETRRGDLRFEHCAGGVKASTGQGILIAFGHRGDLEVHSRHGDMQAFIDEPGDMITLDTGKGTLQCQVPESIEFDLDARVEIGKIGNSFGLDVQKIGDFGAAVVGRRGSAKTKVILRSASGHISFVSRKPN